MATTTKPRPALSREQAAERLKDTLGVEPQSEAVLARQLGLGRRRSSSGGIDTGLVHDALGVLAARHEAKLVPTSDGRSGWCRYDSPLQSEMPAIQAIEFPYEFEKHVPLDSMFVDQDYQRPLTNFVRRIETNFDPYLFGVLFLSDRGDRNKPRRHALIDGQTRWVAATKIGIPDAPAIIFLNLTPQQEASIFWRLQKERRGMVSWYRFRAQLGSGDETSIAIQKLVESCGFRLGSQEGQLKAVGALEACYARSPFLLERALSDLREAWPDRVPEGGHIRGLHFFFRHFPLDKRANQEVNDERLVLRLKVSGPDGLQRKMLAAKQLAGKGTTERFMAMAIQSVYLGGGKA